MPNLLLIGVLAAAPTLLLGGALIAHWAQVQWRREAPIRRREEAVDLLLWSVEQALDPEPSVSFQGLRLLGALYEAGRLEPEDEDFAEEIAKVVIATRLDGVADDEELVVGTTSDVPAVPFARVVLPYELLAALIVIDIATERGRDPGALVWRVANASTARSARMPPLARPDTVPLKRTA